MRLLLTLLDDFDELDLLELLPLTAVPRDEELLELPPLTAEPRDEELPEPLPTEIGPVVLLPLTMLLAERPPRRVLELLAPLMIAFLFSSALDCSNFSA